MYGKWKELFYPDGQTASRPGQGTLYLGSQAAGTSVCCLYQCGSEARELIIMLPPGLIHYDHDTLLKYFTAKFVERYGVAVASALHHNKRKTNLHIHLIFSERKAYDEPVEKSA